MIRIIIILLALFVSVSPVLAQTYEEVQQQQQLYTERVRAETERLQQQEEMERMQKQNEEALAEQRREIERQQDEIRKMKRDSGRPY